MILNFDEYKCLHLGQGNPNLTYKMENLHTSTVRKEKDLRVKLSANFRMSEQCEFAEKQNLIGFLD